MAGLTPLPPTIVHSSTRLTHAQAHAHLSNFLALAENDAAYRPDSTLTERGPQSVSTGANPNLTLHHLQRILQGLEGKRIGGLQDVDRFFGDGAVAAGVGGRGLRKKFDRAGQEDAGTGEGIVRKSKQVENQHVEDTNRDMAIGVAKEAEGWQDKEEYELAQEEDVLDLMDDDRNPGMSLEQPATAEDADEMMGVEVEQPNRKRTKPIDKEARKAAKKARGKAEKRKKNEQK